MPVTVYDQKPQGERFRPCAGDQVRLTYGKHGIRGRGACGAKRGVHRFRSGHPQILGQEAAEMAGARTFVFVRCAPAYRDRPTPALRSTMAFWISTAQRTASTTERNSTSAPSPVRPAAVRPCGSAAELIGRRVKLFGLGRIGITRWPRSRDGAVDRGAAGFATLQADVVAAMAKAGQRGSRGMGQPPRGGDQLFQPRPARVGAIRSPARSSCLGGAPSLLVRPLRSGPPPYLLRSSH